ncbi:MAG: nitroreductase, partial [Clostridiales bacterium]|nr:nitroreductase [Clostridiales bacterium]
AVGLGKGEKLTVVSPVGYTAEKRSMIENIMYRGAGANKRKEWAKLFFDGSFDKGLDKHEAGDYELPLEMLRKGPSASNIQPWRVIRTKGYYHFFLEGTIGYGKALGFNIQKIDIGIALCHFELVSLEAGLKGQWEFLKGKGINSAMIDSVSRPGMEYMVSWKCAEE